jgi:ubiquitin C-terminal hydrolase
MGVICGKTILEKNNEVIRKTFVPPQPNQICIRNTGDWLGLQNLGNTCYINSVIQVLAANNLFMGYLDNFPGLNDFSLTYSLRDLLKELKNTTPPIGYVVPEKFEEKLFTEFKDFEPGRQEDGQELLTKILESIHMDSKLRLEHPKEFNLKKIKQVTIKQLWEHHLSKHASIYTVVFEGLQRVRMSCQGCKNVNHKFEAFSQLTLSLTQQHRKLQAIMEQNFKPDTMRDDNAMHCDACHKRTFGMKTTKIVHMPEVLIIALKRFEFDANRGSFVKIDTEIEYSDTDLVLPVQVSETPTNLELFAVVCHAGTISNGHYYAVIKVGHKWLECNDQKVKELQSSVGKAGDPA